MAISSATFSRKNTLLTVNFDTDTPVTEKITVSGLDVPASAPTIDTATLRTKTFTYPIATVAGPNAYVATASDSNNRVRITGFRPFSGALPLNSTLVNFETFPLEMVTDKASIEISVARNTIYGAKASNWALRDLSIFSTSQSQKRYLINTVFRKIFENETLEVELPNEIKEYKGSLPTEGSIRISGNLEANGNRLFGTPFGLETTLEEALPPGTFFNFPGSSKLHTVTEVINDSEFLFAPPVQAAANYRGSSINFRNPTLTCRATGNSWNLEIPPGHTGEANISNFCRIVMDLEEI